MTQATSTVSLEGKRNILDGQSRLHNLLLICCYYFEVATSSDGKVLKTELFNDYFRIVVGNEDE